MSRKNKKRVNSVNASNDSSKDTKQQPADTENSLRDAEVHDMFETPPEPVSGEETPGSGDSVNVDALQSTIDELNEKYVRLLAEYDNFRKRSSRDLETAGKIATASLMREMLPILDNLDRATEHRESETTLEEYVKGISLIEDQLRQILAISGLKHIEVVGQPFDPNLHEAVMQMESDTYDSGIVSQEVQKGYMLGDRVIRHSKVVVAK